MGRIRITRAALDRRTFVTGTIGGVAASLLGVGCGGGDGDDDGGAEGDGGSGGTGDTGPTCTLYPEQTEGPYYVDVDLIRSDVTEGNDGTPLALGLRVLSDGDCSSIAGAAVEIWQASAGGVYSGIGMQGTTGETFLRGTQITDGDGRVGFQTIYPGWYPGRTAHIHFTVRRQGRSATAQIYFPDDVTSTVYESGVYAIRGQKDTSNAADGVYPSGGGPPPLASVSSSGDGYAASLTITIADPEVV